MTTTSNFTPGTRVVEADPSGVYPAGQEYVVDKVLHMHGEQHVVVKVVGWSDQYEVFSPAELTTV